MTDLLAKARRGRLAALESRSKVQFIRAAIERRVQSPTNVIEFQSRRPLVRRVSRAA